MTADDAVSLRQHLEALRTADKAAVDAALAASIKAIEAALAATDRVTRAQVSRRVDESATRRFLSFST